MFMYGLVQDLEVFWSHEESLSNRSTFEFASQRMTSRMISESDWAEIGLHKNYIRTFGIDPKVDLQTYYRVLRDLFIIIDKDSVDFYWHKYDAHEHLLIGSPGYGFNQQKARFTHSEWMMLQKNIKIFPADNSLMDQFEN